MHPISLAADQLVLLCVVKAGAYISAVVRIHHTAEQPSPKALAADQLVLMRIVSAGTYISVVVRVHHTAEQPSPELPDHITDGCGLVWP